MNNMKVFLLVVLSSCLFVTTAKASIFTPVLNAVNIDENEIEGVLGLGVLIETQPYIGIDNEVYPVPLAVFEYRNFFADGSVFGYTINHKDRFSFSVIGHPRFGAGFDADDSAFLSGMADRDGSFEAGARVAWNHELIHITFDALTDVANEHEGQELSLKFSKAFFDGFLTPRVGLTWYSESFVDYYYGVRGSEGTGIRPPYEGDSTLNYEAGLTVAVPIGKEWALIGDVKYEGLGDDIKDSPIVGDDKILTFVAGVVYRFD